jgi:caffeoyl-CoA O-methyltransferase
VAHKIRFVLAPALQTLDAELSAGRAGAYDFAFIDADKTNDDAYYERCLRLSRSGGLIAIDNTSWSGRGADLPATHDAETAALHALNAKPYDDQRADLSVLPISDGVSLLRKR